MLKKIAKALSTATEVWIVDPHGKKYVDGWADGFHGDDPTSNDTNKVYKHGIKHGKQDRERLLKDDPHMFDKE